MPQNISLLGASYEDVPAVELPKTGGGTARFTDVSETTATATDVMEGKYFYTAAGTKTLGTARASGAIYQDEDGYLVLEEDEDVEEPEAVLFIDYDGTELHSYTRSEFDALTEMPANPVHSGLTAEGWNWTLEDAKAYIGEFPHLTIGQTYITSDGKTRFHLHVREKARKFLFQWYQTKANGVTIDWGDGSEETSITGVNSKTQEHEYDEPGDYVMTITSNDGTWYPTYVSGASSGASITPFKDSSMLRAAYLGLGFPANNPSSTLGWIGSNIRLETITIPSYISCTTSSGSYYLGYCTSLKAFTIPSGWTAIPSYMFHYMTFLKYVSIPKSVTAMGGNAFNYCYKLKYIDLPPNLTNVSLYYCYNVRSLKVPNTVTGTFYVNSLYSLEHMNLPDDFSPTTFSVSGCDYASNTKTMTVPEIGGANISLSYWYGLEEVDLPSTVVSGTSITFSNCYNLRSVALPEGMTALTNSIFSNCYNLEEVDLPSTLTTVGSSAFSSCFNLESIALPSSVTKINGSAFSSCSALLDLELPEEYEFVSNASSVFSGCKALTGIQLPAGMTSIGNSFFNYAVALEEIEIPSTVTSIGASAFSSCVSLVEITIPASVTTIGNSAFTYCNSLREIHFLSETPPTLGSSVFANYTVRTTYGGGATIYVPYSADHSILNAYKTATNWATYADYIQEEPQ